MTARKAVGVLDVMRSATPLVRQVTLCLQGELQAEYDAAQKEMVAASLDKNESLANERTTAAAKQLQRVHERMAASEVVFTFRAIPWMRNVTLKAEHPPRDGNLVDQALGYNAETYTPALLRESCSSVTGVDKKPVTDVPDDVWESMLAALNIEQVEVLRGAALQANERATTVPPSARSLLGSQDSGTSSKSPGPGTSRPRGSKGGSRRPAASQSASTTAKDDSLA